MKNFKASYNFNLLVEMYSCGLPRWGNRHHARSVAWSSRVTLKDSKAGRTYTGLSRHFRVPDLDRVTASPMSSELTDLSCWCSKRVPGAVISRDQIRSTVYSLFLLSEYALTIHGLCTLPPCSLLGK
uniref:Uncharacterized protein n=1 Tax=Molossus molossus TaxID=27622 RepID=A0A7J8GQW8_MOLMO|nr:hypothetical protein HJG59_011387 [Molossus molossus]